jgi:hypothetical protein
MVQPAKPNRLPAKCHKCAMLSADKAKEIHGVEGDGCWNPTVCHSRRSHIRHRDRRNQARNLKRAAGLVENIVVDIEELSEVFSAVLIVYRPPGEETPVHAISASIWKGQKLYAKVQPIHCIGMVPSQAISYVKKMVALLQANYGVKKFVSEERLDPSLCPLRPCPRHPQE